MIETFDFIQHYERGNFKPHPSQLTAEEVGKFYDNFVLASVDVVPMVLSKSAILLGLRSQEPKIWWTIGRAMKPGESPEDTACRALKEEFGFDLPIGEQNTTLGFLGIRSSIFPLREQPPRENGRQCLVINLYLKVKENEAGRFITRSSSSKYLETKWFWGPGVSQPEFDPAISEIATKLLFPEDLE